MLTDPDCNTLCGRPEPQKQVLHIQCKINNSPARIAFPGWVSLALPAGAAAARHRAPRGGLINVPLPCIITNLLASLLTYWRSLLSKRTGAQRAGSGARMMPFRRARRLQQLRLLTVSEQWCRRGTSDVLCATSVPCYHGNVASRQREDDVGWGWPLPETLEVLVAHDERRSRSTRTSGAERSPPSCIIMRVNHDP